MYKCVVPDIRIIGAIDEDAFKDFTLKIDALEASPKVSKKKPLVIEITSEGGSPYIALAIVSRMRRSAFDIVTIASGLVASAATLIFVTGGKRLMTQEAWLMIHEDSGEMSGSVSTLERDMKHMRAMEDQWNVIFADNTGPSAQYWEKLHAEGDTYLTPERCLELGIIDEII